jgi:photosystem I subunit 11
MTVTPVADPCVGNLATPVNSSYFTRAFLNALPAYRPSLSPNRRGLEIGMAHGFFLYGPFAITGPLRTTEFASTAGLLATIGLVTILTVCLSIYGTAGNGPNVQPADATIDNPPADLFTKAGWAEFGQPPGEHRRRCLECRLRSSAFSFSGLAIPGRC